MTILAREIYKIRKGWQWYMLGTIFFVFFPMIQNNYEIWVLKNQSPESFVTYEQPVDSVKTVYAIGEAPEFNFIKIYGIFGPIQGVNTLRCDRFRSEPFVGSGFVTEEQVGVKSENDSPFVFGGNLPDFSTTCTLRSIITICETDHGVCHTVTTDSEVFRFE